MTRLVRMIGAAVMTGIAWMSRRRYRDHECGRCRCRSADLRIQPHFASLGQLGNLLSCQAPGFAPPPRDGFAFLNQIDVSATGTSGTSSISRWKPDDGSRRATVAGMCRNIRTLYNFDPPATEEEI